MSVNALSNLSLLDVVLNQPVHPPVSKVVSKPRPSAPISVPHTKVLVQCILKFLPEEEILSAEHVNKNWKQWASDNAVWKYPCEREGIPPIKKPGTDPKTKEPIELLFYKAAYQHLFPIIFGPKQYSDHLRVKVHGNIVPLRNDIHEKLDRLDPAGQKKFRLLYRSKAIQRTNPDRTTSVVQITIRLMDELVKNPQLRHPTKYDYILKEALDQHGNETLEHSDWILLSSDVVEGTRNLPYQSNQPNEPNQLAVVTALGARPPQLIEAIMMNFFNQLRFGIYPYGRNPWTYSRVDATVTINGVVYRLVVGGGSSAPSGGLHVFAPTTPLYDGHVGLAAAYSCGSSAAIGP